MRRCLIRLAAAASLALPWAVAPGTATAQMAEFRSVPTVEDFLALLAPEMANLALIENRSDFVWRELRPAPVLPPRPSPPVAHPAGGATPAAPSGGAPQPRRPTAIAMPDVFELNSAVLPPNTVATLDNLAAAMIRAPGSQVVITGHTDSTGPVAFNEVLSVQRAQSAQRHLTARHGIDVGRIRIEGVGSRQPIPGLPTTAPNNRRIQFTPPAMR